MSSNFHFLVPESFHTNSFQNGTVVSEKIRIEFLYVHGLGPRSRNDLDLQYSHTFINSIRCLLLPNFMSLAAIVFETPPHCFHFFLSKSTNYKIKVNPGSSFEQTMMGRSPRCYIPSFVEIGLPVPEIKIFEWFLLFKLTPCIVTSIIILLKAIFFKLN